MGSPPSPYKGLTYGKGWGATKEVNGRGELVALLPTLLKGPSNIGASSTPTFGLLSFDWFAGFTTAEPDVNLGTDVTLLLTGTTAAGATVSAQCSYNGQGKVGTPTAPLPTVKCTLPATFKDVKLVDFKPAGKLATLQFYAATDLTYTLNSNY